MATVQTADQSPAIASPEKIWATLDRIAEWHKESELRWKEYDRRREEEERVEAKRRKEEAKREAERREEEAKREAERREEEAKRREEFEIRWSRMDKRFEATERMIRNNGKQIGGLNNSFGELAEHLVGPGIIDRFRELGYHFDGIKERNYKIPGKKAGKIRTEVDLLLENEDTIIAVEIKARPELGEDEIKGDVEHHVQRLEILREYRDAQGMEPKRILGAIAGAIFYDDVQTAAHEAGLFTLEQCGDTMMLDLPKGFVPKEW